MRVAHTCTLEVRKEDPRMVRGHLGPQDEEGEWGREIIGCVARTS